MADQIRVTITNLTSKNLTVRWLSRGAKCIAPKASVDVDYEPWSCLDTIRRNAMRESLRIGEVSLCMHIMSIGGVQYDVDYNPFSTGPGVLNPEAAPVALAEVKAPEKAVEVKEDAKGFDDGSHTITTGTAHASGLGFDSETVKKPVQTAHKEANTGFNVGSAGMSGVKVANENATYLAETKIEKKAAVKTEDTYRSEFNALVEQKKWNEALELLIEEFGEDKVTFSARTIMTIKDYDEIVSRKIKVQ